MPKTPLLPHLSEPEGAAWSGLLRTQALLTQKLDGDLRASAGLTLSEFEILLHLAAAGNERRMAHLAQDLVLTGGGVTRIVARLEKLGFIERKSCDNDGRGVFAVLTERGRAKQRAAQKIHVEGVRRHFLIHASAPDLKVLGKVFGRIVTAARTKAGAGDAACDLSA